MRATSRPCRAQQPGRLSQTFTLSVLGRSSPTLSILSGNNQTVITGGTVAAAVMSLRPRHERLAPGREYLGWPERRHGFGRGARGRFGELQRRLELGIRRAGADAIVQP